MTVPPTQPIARSFVYLSVHGAGLDDVVVEGEVRQAQAHQLGEGGEGALEL